MKLPSAPAVMLVAPATGTWATSARETFSPAGEYVSHEKQEGKKRGMLTLVGQVHGERWAKVDARDEPLVFEFGNSIDGVEDDVFGEGNETRTVHDQEGISFAALELPLSLDGCIRDRACDATR